MSKNISLALLALSVTMCSVVAQSGRRTPAEAAAAHAAGGRVTANLTPFESPASFDMLIHMSSLVVDGIVSRVMPAVTPGTNPDIPLVETYSTVIVSEVMSAVAVERPSSLFVVQEGGKAGKWEVITPDVPLLKEGERYILFLIPDDRATFYDQGTPRYDTVGAWSGFVKVTNNRVHFLPNAAPALHDLDNMDVDRFLALLRRRVDAVVPKRQLILAHPVQVPPGELERARKLAGELK